MQKPFSKNEKQLYFNQIKGIITELNSGEKYCSVTLLVGKETTRHVNLGVKKQDFDQLFENFNKGDKIVAYYYLVSKAKNEKWYTSANLIAIDSTI